MKNSTIAVTILVALTLACGSSPEPVSYRSSEPEPEPVNTQASLDGFGEQLAEGGRGGGEACAGSPIQRVWVGLNAYVCTGSDRLIVRQKPTSSGKEITRIYDGTLLTIIDGPVCADGWSWWKVETDEGVIGWVSEGDGGEAYDDYYICPLY